MSHPTTSTVRKPRRRRLTLGALVAIIVGVAVAMSVGRRPPPAPKLPDPNGYDDIVQAGSLIKGEWPGKGDLAKADLPEVRAFVQANKAALDLARVGLGRECMVPIENSQAGLEKHFETIGPIRSVGRLLQGEARVAEADLRFADALRSQRDGLALGQAVTQGGMAMDQSVGCAVQWLAIIGLRRLRDHIPAAEIPTLLRELEALDRRRPPLEAVEARRLAWHRETHNPLVRIMLRLSGVERSVGVAELNVVRTGRDRVERDLRFLLAELAIHAYHQDKGAWPRSVRDLVPAYLSAVPIDPRTGKPLDYPANADGDLTDDLASIARPDGEVVAPRP